MGTKLSAPSLKTFKGGGRLEGRLMTTNKEDQALYPTGVTFAPSGQIDTDRFWEVRKTVEAEGGLFPIIAEFDQKLKERKVHPLERGSEEALYPVGINPDTCFDCDD